MAAGHGRARRRGDAGETLERARHREQDPSDEGDAGSQLSPILSSVDRGTPIRRNADELERRLAAAQSGPRTSLYADDRAGALGDLSRYVALLREAAAAAERLYSFKLEFPDGRWNVAERRLPAEPRVGDVVSVDGSAWRIRGTLRVLPRPMRKPPRDVFVCAPV